MAMSGQKEGPVALVAEETNQISRGEWMEQGFWGVQGASVHVKSGSFVHVRSWSSVDVTFA